MNSTIKPHLALLLCNFIWALNYPLYKLVLPQYITPLAMLTLALVVAALLSQICDPPGHREKIERRDILGFIGAGILMGVMRKFFLMTGMTLTSPIDASIIITIGPILVLLISIMLGVDRLTPSKVAGITLGMAGTVMLIILTSSGEGAPHKSLGNLIILLCALSTAVYMVFFKKLVTKYRSMTILRWLYGMAALAIIPFGIEPVMHTNFVAMQGHTHVILAFLFILIMPAFLPNLMLIYSLKFVSPTVSSMYGYIQPIIATILATVMGLDKLTWKAGIAALVVFVGVMLVIRSYKNSAATTKYHGLHEL